jgi:catechol 2,3-dioxygenase-like lactoylglutathione lyase family enzyme
LLGETLSRAARMNSEADARMPWIGNARTGGGRRVIADPRSEAYVPAKDFELSKRFYSELGFKTSEGWGGTVDFELDGNRFRLQNYYVKDWANNFMMVMSVDDVEAWHQHAKKLVASGEFPGICIKAPEPVGDSRVLHVVDPSGVLLIFVQ